MSNALISAALGLEKPFLTRLSRSTAAQPATSGVAMLVPPSKKKSESELVPQICLLAGTGAAFLERVDRMHVPGATTSGLNRFSWVGPRRLKAAMPSALLAMWSSWIGLAGYVTPLSHLMLP